MATDMPGQLPDDVRSYVNLIILKEGELGKGFSPKLHLDKLAPSGQTLFIDSDCLIYGSLSRVFEVFKGHNVSVVGSYIAHGEWFGDIETICKKFKIEKMPKFNGGIYYLENGDEAKRIYNTARILEAQYDEIGFVRLRNRPNDEILMALTMQLHGQQPVKDDGSIMAEFVNFRSGINSNILNGKVILFNDPRHAYYTCDWPMQTARPLIVHYLGHFNEIMPYIKEEKHLMYALQMNYPPLLFKTLTFLQTSLPWLLKHQLKELLRPVYRVLVGTRQVKKSERIIT